MKKDYQGVMSIKMMGIVALISVMLFQSYSIYNNYSRLNSQRMKNAGIEAAVREQEKKLEVAARANRIERMRRASQVSSDGQKSSGKADDPAADHEASAWLGRFHTLLNQFEARPGADIPEMGLLSGSDWLAVAREAKLESDDGVRTALSHLRNIAKSRFARDLAFANRKYVADHDGNLPDDIGELAQYLPPSSNAEALGRYEMLQKGKMADIETKTRWLIREKTAVDVDYDDRYGVDAHSIPIGGPDGRGNPRLWVSDPEGYDQMIEKANAAYRTANPGMEPAGLKDVAAFVDPPIEEPLLERLLQYNASRK